MTWEAIKHIFFCSRRRPFVLLKSRLASGGVQHWQQLSNMSVEIRVYIYSSRPLPLSGVFKTLSFRIHGFGTPKSICFLSKLPPSFSTSHLILHISKNSECSGNVSCFCGVGKMSSTFTSWLCSFSNCTTSIQHESFGRIADKSVRRTRRVVLSHFPKPNKQGIDESSGLRETKILNTVPLCLALPFLEKYDTLLSRKVSICWNNYHY
jgi:hypothetical protein